MKVDSDYADACLHTGVETWTQPAGLRLKGKSMPFIVHVGHSVTSYISSTDLSFLSGFAVNLTQLKDSIDIGSQCGMTAYKWT